MALTRMLVIALAAVTVVGFVCPAASAHSPSSVTCTYDFAQQKLSVAITHVVSDPNTHYIYKVDVKKNGALAESHSYTDQPMASPFTRIYDISAQNGDVLSATAYCSIAGSRTGQVTVQGAALDSTPPSVVVISPSNGAIFYTSQITVTGTASDNIDVAQVEIRVGAGEWRLATGTESWTATVGLSPGNNTVTARATDSASNTGTATVTATYNVTTVPDSTAPTIVITDPLDGADFEKATLTARGTASDVAGISRVEVRVNGGSWFTADGTTSWTVQATLAEGSNTIEAMAIDTSNNNATVSVIVTYNAPSGDSAEPLARQLWPYHAATMVFGFSLVVFAVFSMRAKRAKWRFRVHRAAGLAGALLSAGGVLLALYMTDGGHFRVPHAFLGAATLAMALVVPMIGFTVIKARKKNVPRALHIWFGRLLVVMMLLAILSGMTLVGII